MYESFQMKVSFFDYDNSFQHEMDILLYIFFILNVYFMPIVSHAYNLKDLPFTHVPRTYVQDINML